LLVVGCWLLVATYQLEEPEIFGNAVLKKIDEATKVMPVRLNLPFIRRYRS